MVAGRGAALRLFTVGHSTRAIDELIAILRAARMELLVDVRRFPGSRRHPQFAKEALASALVASGFEYRHEVDLGGMRLPRPDSPNRAWRVEMFRGYADYTATEPFQTALERVLTEAARRRTAVLCAEADPARCHRRLIADVVTLRGWEVEHLLASGASERHAVHPRARLAAHLTVVWSGEQPNLGFDA